MPPRAKPKKVKREPLWKGPEVDGVTFSMLSKFLVCRERFRVRVIEGLRPEPEFKHRIEFGSMWHVCEENHAAGSDWQGPLRAYGQQLCMKYPTQQRQINHWYFVCRAQFPIYVAHWKKHPDVTSRMPLYQEQVFDEKFKLPSGRTVRLRGKWDSVDEVGKGRQAAYYIQEDKTKGDIDSRQIETQLAYFDLQTGLYSVAFSVHRDRLKLPLKFKGVRYNVIRRPLSGGKHSIKKHKPTKKNPTGETDNEFYTRLTTLIAGDPRFFFARWKVELSENDLTIFKKQILVPILEQLCDWYEAVTSLVGGELPSIHYRFPYGVYNPVLEGGTTEVDEYLSTGSMIGLTQVDNLFPELEV